MKRDMDLVRELLLVIENDAMEPFAGLQQIEVQGQEPGVIDYHLSLMIDAGMIVGEIQPYLGGELSHFIHGLTWIGHDFLDSVRDPDIWAKTKQGANAVRSWSFETLKEIGKGLIKKQIEKYTGVEVG